MGICTPFHCTGKAFELYVLGKGIINIQKHGLFLHTASLEVQDVYFTLAPDGEDRDYPTTPKVLDDYFIPKANVPLKRQLFCQITQSSKETIDQFVSQLRQHTASCDFGEQEDEYIRDQLIDKRYSVKLRQKFLEKDGNAALDDLLITARAQEAVYLQMVTMGGNANSEQLNNVTCTGLNRNVDRRSCFNCGQRIILQRIEDVLQGGVNVTSVENSVI